MSMPKVMTIAQLGGEYLSVNISGLGTQSEEVGKILQESRREMEKPSTTKFIELHVYRTKMTPDNMTAVADWFSGVDGHARRVAVIGASFFDKLKVKRVIGKTQTVVKYLFDIDEAKDWLLGKLKK